VTTYQAKPAKQYESARIRNLYISPTTTGFCTLNHPHPPPALLLVPTSLESSRFPYKYHCSHTSNHTSHLPMKMELIGSSKTLEYTNQMLGNYPKENLPYSEHGESLKSRMVILAMTIASVTASHGKRHGNIGCDNRQCNYLTW
jgi:hypothetical protein